MSFFYIVKMSRKWCFLLQHILETILPPYKYQKPGYGFGMISSDPNPADKKPAPETWAMSKS